MFLRLELIISQFNFGNYGDMINCKIGQHMHHGVSEAMRVPVGEQTIIG
jgi:hypothetical protein